MKIKLLALLGCFPGLLLSAPSESGRPVRVVTSFYPVYVAALNVARGVGGVEIHNLAKPHVGCLHDYRLTAADARELAGADLLLANGAGMETFLEKIRAQNPRLKIVDTSEGLPLTGGNAHVWLSPARAREQIGNIARSLAAADPANTARYEANAAAYCAELDSLDARMKEVLAPFRGKAFAVQLDTFRYLLDNLQIETACVIESAPGREPSARELSASVAAIRAKSAEAVITEPQESDRTARIVARETGARMLQLDPVVTGPSDPEEARGAYLRAMRKNLEVLQDALRE